MEEHISTIKLHQYRYGELSPEARLGLESHLESCTRCAERFQHQVATRSEFEVLTVPTAILEAAEAPSASLWARWSRWVWLAAAPLALAAVAIFAMRATPPAIERPLEPEIARAKGVLPTLEAWVGTAEGARALSPHEAVTAGDVVQLMVDPEGRAWVALAGRDGTGQLEVYGAFAAEDREGLSQAPFSLTLDEAPGPQVFYVVTSDSRPSDGEIRAAIDGGAASDVSVASLELPKE